MEPWQVWCALNMTKGVGPALAMGLYRHFGDLSRLPDLSFNALSRVPRFSKATVETFLKTLDSKEFDEELALVKDHQVRVVCPQDAGYPQRLLNIPQPPLVLYISGQITGEDEYSVAVVGSRQATNYGRVMAEYFGQALAEVDVTVISGLARGIDSYALRGALTAERGRVIAVLGNGLLTTYPKENASLQEEIALRGAVVSELPMRAKPSRSTFPQRNRLMSALTRGVLVIEAGEQSGALLTANIAAEQGKEVFALPGRADSEFSMGTNRLIQIGAKLTITVDDILTEISSSLQGTALPERTQNYLREELRTLPPKRPEQSMKQRGTEAQQPKAELEAAPAELPPEHEAIVSILRGQRLTADDVAAKLDEPVQRVTIALLHLELGGYVRKSSGGMFTADA